MISYVKGEVAAFEAEKVIIDVNGIGYGIYMSQQAMGRLPMIGSEVKLYTYFSVKEDSMQLFGFLSKDELEVFRLIIGVNGIGPKGGLGILSVLTPNDLRFAVMSKDVKAISTAPGIGKKTAEKLILELKDKLRIEDALEQSQDNMKAGISNEAQSAQMDAVQALVALGYGNTEALKAVKNVGVDESTTTEMILKNALKYLM